MDFLEEMQQQGIFHGALSKAFWRSGRRGKPQDAGGEETQLAAFGDSV